MRYTKGRCFIGAKKREIWSENTKERAPRNLTRSEPEQRAYRERSKPEQQRLADLVTTMEVDEGAKALGRPLGSAQSMLDGLGVGASTEREWFTKVSLSRALHTPPEEIQKWIDRGWLKERALKGRH